MDNNNFIEGDRVEDKLLTPAEVAERLQVSTKTVTRWLSANELKGVQLGPRLWRIPETELEAFLKARTNLTQ